MQKQNTDNTLQFINSYIYNIIYKLFYKYILILHFIYTFVLQNNIIIIKTKHKYL